MRTLEPVFQTNANATGLQEFKQIKRGMLPSGKSICIYQRTRLEGPMAGQIFGFEVVIPSVKKAGTYPLPGGKTITYNEDFEEYPGASKFGFSAWYGGTLATAELVYNRKTTEAAPVIESEDDGETDAPVVVKVPGKRGRPRVERPLITLPPVEFSVKELAELNKVQYVIAYQFLKEEMKAGHVKETREERRASRGPMTQLFQKV